MHLEPSKLLLRPSTLLPLGIRASLHKEPSNPSTFGDSDTAGGKFCASAAKAPTQACDAVASRY